MKNKAVAQVVTIPRSKVKAVKHTKGNGKLRLTKDMVWQIGAKIPPPPTDLFEPKLSETARYIGQTRYALRDDKGEPKESDREMFWRVAYNIACGDLLYDPDEEKMHATAKKFYSLMATQRFIPNTPTMLNAGKREQQLSACFVLPIEDDMYSIGKTIVDMMMIHKSGGGCIASDARVWTTFCGLEPIEVFVSRAIADGRIGVKQGQGIAYDVSDLNIKTVAMNPQTGEAGLKGVTHVWQFDVPANQQVVVTTREGTEVQTSSWHPFIVVRGTELIEVKAENLTCGDIIFGPGQVDEYWPWRKFRSIGLLTVNEDLGWLIGFTLGDGSFGYVPALRQYRVRWFSGIDDVLKKLQTILLKHDVKVSIQKDRRGLLSIATLNQRFVHDLLETCGLEKFGPKNYLIKIPEIITKSPLSVVKAFLAGLLDSDGYVASDGSPSYSTVSHEMAQDLAALLSLMGFRPSINSKKPHGKGKLVIYTVQLCPLPQVNQLRGMLKSYLASQIRRRRLKSTSRRQSVLPLQFRAWRDLFHKFGLVKRRFSKDGVGPISSELNRWSSYGRINRDSLLSVAEHVKFHDEKITKLLKRIAISGQEVKEIKLAETPKRYFDLSIEDWNTYAAGSSGMVMIHNTGFSFSRLRPMGDIVSSSGGRATGPCAFLQAYNDVTSQVKQGGVRRGANMGIMHITHPDVLRFAVMKVDEFNLTNFNISVTVTEKWLEKVKEDQKFVDQEPSWDDIIEVIKQAQQIRDVDLKLKKTEDGVVKLYDLVRAKEEGEGFELVNPRNGQVTDKLNAYKVFLLITKLAWQYGDPGMILIDRINNSAANPTPNLGQIESTNPCGEQPLLPYDACTLGSINVGKFVKDNQIDFEELGNVAEETVHFLDNVLDMNNYPVAEIADMTSKIRRVGLGVMGLADLLYALGISYNSEEGLEVAERVMECIQSHAKTGSAKLAKLRGVFPAWKGSIFDPDSPHFRGELLRVRNAAVTTIAPTGTIAMLADASSGIEPYFALSYAKNTIEGKRLFNTNPAFLQVAKEEGFYSDELLEKIEGNNGSVAGLEEVPEKWQKVFVTTRDISPEWHVRMQAAFQKQVDNAISKTINFPFEATVDDVRRAYMLVYETGCKGITIYRDGSRQKQVLEVKKEASYYDQLARDGKVLVKEKGLESKDSLGQRPVILRGRTYKLNTPVGEAFITINRDDLDHPFEIFVTIGKAGMHTAADAEAIGRLISLTLRISRPNSKEIAQRVVNQLRGIGGASQVGFGKDRVMSLADAVAKAMTEDLSLNGHGEKESVAEPIPLDLTLSISSEADICPECGQFSFVFEEGCQKCYSCGYSKC